MISCFELLGTLSLTVDDYQECLPTNLIPIERFLCSIYAPTDCPIRKIPELRHNLFLSKNIEKLPPSIAAFYLHLLRTNFTAARYKSYVTAVPNLPEITLSGWKIVDEKFVPVLCLLPPAPKSILELVKCGCNAKKGGCKKGKCSCYKNDLPCTPLCKCYSTGCENFVKTTSHRESAELGQVQESEEGDEDSENLY